MRKAIVVFMLVLVLSLGAVNVYSLSNAGSIASSTLSADNSTKPVDTAPSDADSILDISVNKGME